jgi:hypothetical protein
MIMGVIRSRAGSKLSMQVSFGFESLQTATLAFILDHAAIVGLGACVAHYAAEFAKRGPYRMTDKKIARLS